MFTHVYREVDPLQQQLDRERELFERQAPQEEIAQSPAAVFTAASFAMIELYTIIPGCNIEPIRMDAYRGRIRQYG